MAGWSAVSQNIGIAVSEDISVVADATISTAFIDTAITASVALNDIIENVDDFGTPDSTDLLQITIADVVALANNDHGGTISLEGVIQDTAGTPNVTDAASNAQVVIEDAFPPMVVSAIWDGTTMTVVFNEDIDDSQAVTMDFISGSAVSFTMDPAVTDVNAKDYFTYDDETFTLVVNTDSTADIAGSFLGVDDTSNESFLYDDDADDTDEEQHGVLNIDNVSDTHGNKWFDYRVADVSATALRWAVEAPQFLAVNQLGSFNYTVKVTGIEDTGVVGDDDGFATVVIDFSHPLDESFATGLDSNNNGSIEQSEILDLFAISLIGDGSDTKALGNFSSNLSATYDSGNRQVIVKLDEGANTILVDATDFIIGNTGVTGLTVRPTSAFNAATQITTVTFTEN